MRTYDFQKLRAEYDSDEEVYFHWYLQELKKLGYIKGFKRLEKPEDTINIFLPRTHHYKEILKTKDKLKLHKFLDKLDYTPDYKILWDKKSLGIFIVDLSYPSANTKLPGKPLPEYISLDFISYVEVKPVFDQNNMTRDFIVKQKTLFNVYDIYINLVKVPTIFKKTFVPKRYLKTNITEKDRTIKFKTKDINTYIEERKAINGEIQKRLKSQKQ